MIESRWESGLDGAAVAAAGLAIDLDADESTCPACLGAIPRGAAKCPGCGLRFG